MLDTSKKLLILAEFIKNFYIAAETDPKLITFMEKHFDFWRLLDIHQVMLINVISYIIQAKNADGLNKELIRHELLSFCRSTRETMRQSGINFVDPSDTEEMCKLYKNDTDADSLPYEEKVCNLFVHTIMALANNI